MRLVQSVTISGLPTYVDFTLDFNKKYKVIADVTSNTGGATWIIQLTDGGVARTDALYASLQSRTTATTNVAHVGTATATGFALLADVTPGDRIRYELDFLPSHVSSTDIKSLMLQWETLNLDGLSAKAFGIGNYLGANISGAVGIRLTRASPVTFTAGQIDLYEIQV